MIKLFRASLFLVIFTVLINITKPESNITTDSDVEEEEEEKKPNVVLLENEFPGSTFVPDDATTKSNVGEKKTPDIAWNRDFNLTDYDEPQILEEGKQDANPENSVDQDSAENINDFLQDNPDREDMDVETTKSQRDPHSISFNVGNETLNRNGTMGSLAADSTPISSRICKFGERCKLLDAINERAQKLKEKLSTETVTSDSSLKSSNKTSKFSDSSLNDSFVTSAFFPATKQVDNVTSAPNFNETVAGATAENVIVVDGTDEVKEESVIQGFNKTLKVKPVKLATADDLPDEIIRTFTKESETSERLPLDKNTHDSYNEHINSSTDLEEPSSLMMSETDFVTMSSMVDSQRFLKIVSSTNSPMLDKLLPNSHLQYDRSKIVANLTPANGEIANAKDNTAANDNKLINIITDKVKEAFPSTRESDGETIEFESSESIKPSFKDTNYSHINEVDLLPPGVHTPHVLPILTSPLNEDTTTPHPITSSREPPPGLTNPGCSSLPVCIEIILLETSWDQFCGQTDEFREFLSKYVSHYTRPVRPHHIVFDAQACAVSPAVRLAQNTPDLTIPTYVTNEAGEYEERLTYICGVILRKWAPTAFHNSVIEVRVYNNELQGNHESVPIPEFSSGLVAAVSISAIAGVALCLLAILLIVMKQKMQSRCSETTTPSGGDAYSLDSLSISASFRRRRGRRSIRSYLNHAFNDQEIPTHPLSVKTLTNCLKNKDLLDEEFRRIPMNMPKLDSIPEGAHVKNRYSNILPNPETRVILDESTGDPFKSYINANFIKGYEGKSAFYIACQAPLPEGIEDFWRMVWQQQAKVIIMLTMLEENGTARCAEYFPHSTLISQPPFGGYQVTLMKKDVYEFYTISTMRLLDIEKTLFRDITHLWFTAWPNVGVPKDPVNLITFVQECRRHINKTPGPAVVHCSTGTGRTGVFLGLDILMREYDQSASIDILQCVSQLRRDRGGAVQNKDQYILIHEAMLDYASRVGNQSHRPSISSKA